MIIYIPIEECAGTYGLYNNSTFITLSILINNSNLTNIYRVGQLLYIYIHILYDCMLYVLIIYKLQTADYSFSIDSPDISHVKTVVCWYRHNRCNDGL